MATSQALALLSFLPIQDPWIFSSLQLGDHNRLGSRESQRDHIPVGLHHHISVEAPLSGTQAGPLLLRQENSHILEGHLDLRSCR